MKSLLVSMLVLMLFLAGSITAQASECGFVKVIGKKLNVVRDEAKAIEKVVNHWKDGEVLFTKETTTGSVFKHSQILVILAGASKDVLAFLEKAPYEGDIIKELKGKFLFNSVKTGNVHGIAAIGLVRKFPGIREVNALINNASAGTVYNQLKSSDNMISLSHITGAGVIYNGTIRPENLLFTVEGSKFVDESKLVAPPGWNAMKDYTEQEAKDFINGLEL